MRYDGIDYEAEWNVMRQRFLRTVRAENMLLNIAAGKEPLPTDRQWFMDMAIMIGVPDK